MTYDSETERKLTNALVSFASVKLPGKYVLRRTIGVPVNGEASDEYMDTTMELLEMLVIERLSDNKMVIVYRSELVGVNYAIVDSQSGCYTRMDVAQLTSFFSQPQGSKRITINQLAHKAYEISTTMEVFHPIKSS